MFPAQVKHKQYRAELVKVSFLLLVLYRCCSILLSLGIRRFSMAYIHFVYITSKLLLLTMFVTAALQRKLLLSYLVSFLFRLHIR
jgi:hypothetical protein